MHKERIRKLAIEIKTARLDYYLISTHCEYDVEYLPDYTSHLEWLTGFDGSNGLLLLSADEELIFFTDSRYLTQARQQLELLRLDLQIYNITEIKKKLPKKMKIGYSSKLYSQLFLKKFAEDNNIIALNLLKNLNSIINKEAAFIYPQEFAGSNHIEKINQVCAKLETNVYFFNNPASLCWLLNIRGQDIDYNLIFLCYGLLYKDTAKLQIFCADPSKLKINYENIEILSLDKLDGVLKIQEQIGASENISSYYHNLIGENLMIKNDPCSLLRSIKNNIEIENALRIHILDGVALVKFWYWLECNLPTTEIEAQERLAKIRRKSKEFFNESFATISGFNENGAMIHYRASEKTNKKIAVDGLYLLDSGGHYWGGTTDVTRVFAIGEITDEQKYHYTLVLQSHLKLIMGLCPKNIPLHQLNAISREILWNTGLDCPHSIGHGVSNFLEVHEGPYAINSRCTLSLVENIIISNEPGLYFEGEYGIRIENLIYSKIYNNDFIKFENLTMVPYDWNLIDQKMLTIEEIDYISDYHSNIASKLNNYLNEGEKEWLMKKINLR